MNEGYRTVRQIIHRLETLDYNEVLNFKLGDKIYEEWYGMTKADLFDSTVFVIGSYGAGIEYYNNTFTSGYDYKQSFIDFLSENSELENIDEDTEICIDLAQWK